MLELICFSLSEYSIMFVFSFKFKIANLFFSKTRGVDLQGMKKFLDEYYCNEKPLKDDDVLLIKEYALRWINYILDGNEFDTSTTESFKEKYRLIKENL